MKSFTSANLLGNTGLLQGDNTVVFEDNMTSIEWSNHVIGGWEHAKHRDINIRKHFACNMQLYINIRKHFARTCASQHIDIRKHFVFDSTLVAILSYEGTG